MKILSGKKTIWITTIIVPNILYQKLSYSSNEKKKKIIEFELIQIAIAFIELFAICTVQAANTHIYWLWIHQWNDEKNGKRVTIFDLNRLDFHLILYTVHHEPANTKNLYFLPEWLWFKKSFSRFKRKIEEKNYPINQTKWCTLFGMQSFLLLASSFT